MTQPAKVQEPSMEEILASIRRIIADDEKPAAAGKATTADATVAKSRPATSASAAPAKPADSNSQDDIDAMLANLDAATTEEEVRPAQVDEVFELTDEMAVPHPAQAAFQKVEPQDDLEFAEMAPAPAPASRPSPAAVDRPAIPNAVPAAQILSQSTVSAVETAFNSLATTVLSNNARTLEDLVKEMLRPMLKSWLDDNLPGLVERIVKAEIERVSRGRQ